MTRHPEKAVRRGDLSNSRELQSLENQLIFKVANGAVKVDVIWTKMDFTANVGTGGDSSGKFGTTAGGKKLASL